MGKKYFYNDGKSQFGPFSLDELKSKNIKKNTQVWHKDLDHWIEAKEIEELKELIHVNKPFPIYKALLISFSTIFLVTIIFFIITKNNTSLEINKIRNASYDSDVDFNFYVEKFYRDLEFFGLYPTRPKETIIKLADLDKVEGLTHYHGVSLGFEDDQIIEIYINGETWKKLKKPMKYWLMYHELAHDILNVDDLEISEENQGKLMYPEFSKRQGLSMDDFIEGYKTLFEQISGKNPNKSISQETNKRLKKNQNKIVSQKAKEKKFFKILDENFEQALIQQNLDNILDGRVLINNVKDLIALDLTQKNISNLSGIEEFKSLRTLYVAGNPLININLMSNTNLEELNCSSCNLNLLDLSENLKLKTLFCINNNLKKLNLNKNKDLTYLDCEHNSIKNLDISNNLKLKTLYCKGNQFNCEQVKSKIR